MKETLLRCPFHKKLASEDNGKTEMSGMCYKCYQIVVNEHYWRTQSKSIHQKFDESYWQDQLKQVMPKAQELARAKGAEL